MRTLSNAVMCVAVGVWLGGCSGSRTASDDSASAPTTLRLDFISRAALNTSGREMSGLSVPTLVRVYQLRTRAGLETASYDSLVADSGQLPGDDVLVEHGVVVQPGQGAQLNMPLAADARFVAVVALFRDPDLQAGSWRVILSRSELDPLGARVLELGDNRLTLLPAAEG